VKCCSPSATAPRPEIIFQCELGHVLAGLATGRTEPGQITLFNSVGLALQDLAFAALATGRTGDPLPRATRSTAPRLIGASATQP
jgi:hypothetical protein